MEYLVEGNRTYELEVHLGVTTSTYDGEGEIVRRGDPSGTNHRTLEESLKSFQGTVYQTPPMYSALKIGGKRLYTLARSGIEVEREPRKVEISRIEILEWAPPLLVLKVESGKGAYMRSLAHDLGEGLGCGGYLRKLVRLRSGPFLVAEAIKIATLQETDNPDSWKNHLRPSDFVLLHLRSVTVSRAAERFIRSGHAVSLPAYLGINADYMEPYRAYTQDGRFLAVVRFDKSRNQWQPHKVFNLDTPSPYAPTRDET